MQELINTLTPSLLTVLIAVPFLYALYLRSAKKLTADKLCAVILASGFVLRLAYVYYTGDYERQHDVGRFYEKNYEHSGYIVYLVENHRLPDIDPRGHWQFYHPPLHHIVSAVLLSIAKALGVDYREAAPTILQFAAAVYSWLFCFTAFKSFKLLGLKDGALTAAVACVTFHPTLIILSGSYNNDMLSSLLGMAALYFTIRWSADRRFRSIIPIALTLGLGMITKLTVGLLAPAIAAVFLAVLIQRRSEWKRLLCQFAVFGVICVPIGLSWTIRNAVKFHMPPNYVPGLAPDSGQYIADPPLHRLLNWSLRQFASPFTQWEWDGAPYNEGNPIIALLKNAMFDEQTFFPQSITLQSFCTALFFAGAVTAVLSAAAFIFLWKKQTSAALPHKLLLTIVFAVIFGNYIIFCINYPQVCTENMRYCVPLIFSGSAAIGSMMQNKPKKGFWTKAASAADISVKSMCALSAFIYTVMLFYTMVEY